MTADVRELYQETLLDHAKSPHHCRAMDAADRHAEGFNPLCGDKVDIYVKLDGSQIGDVSFTSKACAICTASASMMADLVQHLGVDAAVERIDAFRALMTGDAPADEAQWRDAAVLAGVRRFPMRVKCATLPWHTLREALTAADKQP